MSSTTDDVLLPETDEASKTAPSVDSKTQDTLEQESPGDGSADVASASSNVDSSDKKQATPKPENHLDEKIRKSLFDLYKKYSFSRSKVYHSMRLFDDFLPGSQTLLAVLDLEKIVFALSCCSTENLRRYRKIGVGLLALVQKKIDESPEDFLSLLKDEGKIADIEEPIGQQERPTDMAKGQDKLLSDLFANAASKEEICEMLVAARKMTGLTQQEVADRMGIQRTNLIKLEKGLHNSTSETLSKYVEALGYKLEFRIV